MFPRLAALLRSYKLRIFVSCVVALVVLHSFFGKSVYNIRILDFNAQIFYGSPKWPSKKGQGGDMVVLPGLNSRAPTILTSHTLAVVDKSTTSPYTALETSTSIFESNAFESQSNSTDSLSNSSSVSVSSSYQNTSLPSEISTLQPLVFKSAGKDVPLCPVVPPVLVGPIRVWFDKPTFEALEKMYPWVEPGGHSKPANCTSRHRVAIIIPFRDRFEQLRVFLHNMHDLLHKQQLDFAIYIIEQIQNQTFNRAKLMNIGYAEAVKHYDWQCFIFHDVDLLPEDDRNIYSCPEQPRHMSVAIDKFSYKLPYADIFGGITALTTKQFQKVNGYSNDFWGWGGEDDEMASRVLYSGFKISRYQSDIARYKMMKHVHEETNPVNKCRFSLMYKYKTRMFKDGINSLRYKVLRTKAEPLYTIITVDLFEEVELKKLAGERVC